MAYQWTQRPQKPEELAWWQKLAAPVASVAGAIGGGIGGFALGGPVGAGIGAAAGQQLLGGTTAAMVGSPQQAQPNYGGINWGQKQRQAQAIDQMAGPQVQQIPQAQPTLAMETQTQGLGASPVSRYGPHAISSVQGANPYQQTAPYIPPGMTYAPYTQPQPWDMPPVVSPYGGYA